jgi:hypothetical protein
MVKIRFKLTKPEKKELQSFFWACFSVLSVLISFYLKTGGWHKGVQIRRALSWSEFFEQLPYILFGCFVLSIVLLLIQAIVKIVKKNLKHKSAA